jgi:Domain of unknown function (DUF4123)
MESAEEFYNAWLTDLINGITAQSERFPDAHLYTLIDGAQIKGITRQISNWKTAFALPLFSDTKEASLTNISPWLVLSPTHQQAKFLKQTIELQGAAHAVTWLISPLSADVLFQALQRRMDAKLSGDMAMLLRYFDTYRLPDLHQVLDDEQRKAFFGCANAWVYLSRQGELAVIDSEYLEQDLATELVFNDKQEQVILEASFPDELLRILQQDQAELVENMPPQERYDRVKALVKQAQSYGIEGSKDLLYYCIVGLSEGEEFDVTPSWAAILARVKQDKVAFADAALA